MPDAHLIGIDRHCGNILIHPPHDWTTYVPADPDDPEGDAWLPVDAWCEGNDDQDDPLDRFECCVHCASGACPTRDGHPGPCATCRAGQTMLGEPTGAAPGSR